jgi:mevalonate pyrophosphate decarboxylase
MNEDSKKDKKNLPRIRLEDKSSSAKNLAAASSAAATAALVASTALKLAMNGALS